MKKLLALFDIDKTIFNGLSYFKLLETQVESGFVEGKCADYAGEALRRYENASLGYEDLVKELLDIYVRALQGKTVDEVVQSTNDFFRESSDFFGYVEPTIELLSPSHEIILVTGSSQFTATAVAEVFSIRQFCSSVFGIEENCITGQVNSYLSTRWEKREAIRHLTEGHPHAGSFAFGDSEGDIKMLQATDHPIRIDPTSGLREVADDKGWVVVDSRAELASKRGLAVVRAALG